MHVDPDRILIMAARDFAEIELHCIERFMNAAVIADVFENAVYGPDDAAFAADISWRARVAGRIFGGHHDGVTDLVFAARFAHRPPQSGRTRGISAPPWAASLARCSPGSSA